MDETSGFTRDWVLDENGVPRYRVDYRDKTDYFQILRRREDRRWETFVARTIDLPEIDLHGLDADGELIIGVRPTRWRPVRALHGDAHGTLGRTVYAHDMLDVSDVRVDPYTTESWAPPRRARVLFGSTKILRRSKRHSTKRFPTSLRGS